MESGSNSPGILFEKVAIGSYGSSIGTLLEEDDELLDELEGKLLDELELDELDELDELLEELLDELTLELLEIELLDDAVELLELVTALLSFALLDCSLEVLSLELVSSILVEVLASLEEKLDSLGVLVTQEDKSKAPNIDNE